jgi:5'-nucleotidase
VLLVDAGDATQGTPLVDVSDGASAIAFMNSCGYDAMAVGNHEFDWGLEKLAENRKQAKFPMLSANVFDKDGKLLFEESKVFELSDGTKVGFFGLTTPSSMTSTLPEHVEGLTFSQDEGLFDCAQAQVDALRGKGCDLVVCLGHLGNVDAVGRNTSTDVLQNVTGIDLFIDGHDHQLVEEEVNGVLLTETGCYMHSIGVVVIDDGVPKNEPVAYGQYAGIEPATQAVIAEENARVEGQLGVVLARRHSCSTAIVRLACARRRRTSATFVPTPLSGWPSRRRESRLTQASLMVEVLGHPSMRGTYRSRKSRPSCPSRTTCRW